MRNLYDLNVHEAAKSGYFLKITCAAGGLTLLLFLGLIIAVSLMVKNGGTAPDKGAETANFYKNLNLFDRVLARGEAAGGVNHTHVKNLLEALDKGAAGAEARLSVLKRYRNLAKRYPEYLGDYRKAAEAASGKYPHSALIAALAAEAALYRETGLDEPAAEKLNRTALLLSENGPLSEASFFPVAFCLYALGGVLEDIDSAAAVKHIDGLFAAFIESLRGAETGEAARARESMLVDAALVKIAGGEAEEAGTLLSRLDPHKDVRPKTLSFMANYSYDFASPLFAAELWTRAGGDRNLARAASALYLSGGVESARNLWRLLIKDAAGAPAPAETDDIRAKVLFNLAVTGSDDSEKIFYLEQLLAGTRAGVALVPALILYTRLQDEDRALAILRDSPLVRVDPLLDLEYTRRLTGVMPVDRSAAETWLLLNRHGESRQLYRWAAWYFEYQRRYEDMAALHRFAAQNGVEDPVLDFHRALQLVRQGNTLEGEAALESCGEIPQWLREANLALIFDARREYAAALRRYEAAAATIPLDTRFNGRAARLYLKIARCKRILGGNPEEIRRDLERARSLDGENIDARMAPRKLDIH
jgi:tetratricopeptide (TPR) repeat protein